MALLPVDQAGNGYREAYPRPLARRALHTKLPAELESPVPHGLPAYTGRGSFWVEPTSVVGHLDVGELTVETQLYRSTLTWPASACRRTFVSASWTRRVSSWPALSGSLAGKSSSTTSSTSYLPRAIRRFRSTRFSSEETTERSSVSLRRSSKMAPRSPSTERLRASAVASRAGFRSSPETTCITCTSCSA